MTIQVSPHIVVARNNNMDYAIIEDAINEDILIYDDVSFAIDTIGLPTPPPPSDSAYVRSLDSLEEHGIMEYPNPSVEMIHSPPNFDDYVRSFGRFYGPNIASRFSTEPAHDYLLSDIQGAPIPTSRTPDYSRSYDMQNMIEIEALNMNYVSMSLVSRTQTSVTLDVRFRYIDANNSLDMRCSRTNRWIHQFGEFRFGLPSISTGRVTIHNLEPGTPYLFSASTWCWSRMTWIVYYVEVTTVGYHINYVTMRLVSRTQTSVTLDLNFRYSGLWNRPHNSLYMHCLRTNQWTNHYGESRFGRPPINTGRHTIYNLTPGTIYIFRATTWCWQRGIWVSYNLEVTTEGYRINYVTTIFVSATQTSVTLDIDFRYSGLWNRPNNSLYIQCLSTNRWTHHYGAFRFGLPPINTGRHTIHGLYPGTTYRIFTSTWCWPRGIWVYYTIDVTTQAPPLMVQYRSVGHTSGTLPASQGATPPATIRLKHPGDLARPGYFFGGWVRNGVVRSPGNELSWPAGASGTYIFYANWIRTPDFPIVTIPYEIYVCTGLTTAVAHDIMRSVEPVFLRTFGVDFAHVRSRVTPRLNPRQTNIPCVATQMGHGCSPQCGHGMMVQIATILITGRGTPFSR